MIDDPFFTVPARFFANSTQIGGDHYHNKAIQPWDYIVQNNLGYLEGCIIKYVSRYKEKNGVEDLEKARHFLDKLIEVTNERLQEVTASQNKTPKYEIDEKW